MAKGLRIQMASRLNKAAADLYFFVEHRNDINDPDKYLTALANLLDVSAVEVEQEITQLKRSLGGLSAKVSSLQSELALKNAQLDKIRNDASPAVGMAARYES